MKAFLSKPVHLLATASALFMIMTGVSIFTAARLFSDRSFEDVAAFEKTAALAHIPQPQVILLRQMFLDASRNTDAYISSVASTICASLVLVLIIPLFGRAFASARNQE